MVLATLAKSLARVWGQIIHIVFGMRERSNINVKDSLVPTTLAASEIANFPTI